MIDYALSYAERGLRVFPLKPGDKEPDGDLAPHGVYSATTDAALIRRWWSRAPDDNIGIACGNGIIVVDCDNDDGLTALLEGGLPPTVTVQTGKGWHFYFRTEARIKNRVKVMDGIDVRSAGGYVVAPPSIHPSGSQYRFDVGFDDVVGGIAPLPEWLRERLSKPKPEPEPVASNGASAGAAPLAAGAGPADAGAAALYGKHIAALKNAHEGERNETLNVSAYVAGALVEAGRLDEQTALSDLTTISRTIGLDERERQKTIRSGFEDSKKTPLHSRPAPTAPATAAPAPAGAAPAATVRIIRPDELQELEPQELPQRFRLYSIEEWMALPDPEWLVEGILQRDTLAQIVAQWTGFKTFVALELACCIVTGLPWYGRPVVAGPVVYISAEGSVGIRRRFRAWQKARGVSLEGKPLKILADTPHFTSADDADMLLRLITALPEPPALIVVDTLAKVVLPGDENSARDVGLVLETAEQLRRSTGCCLLFLHHPSRASRSQSRGSGALPAGISTELCLERDKDGNVVTVKCSKQKDGAEFADFALTPRVVLLSDDDPDDSSLVLEPSDMPVNEPTPSQKTMLDALRSLGAGAVKNIEWQKACETAGVARATFYANTPALAASRRVIPSGTGKAKTWRVAD